jgi:hypothetical protein
MPGTQKHRFWERQEVAALPFPTGVATLLHATLRVGVYSIVRMHSKVLRHNKILPVFRSSAFMRQCQLEVVKLDMYYVNQHLRQFRNTITAIKLTFRSRVGEFGEFRLYFGRVAELLDPCLYLSLCSSISFEAL